MLFIIKLKTVNTVKLLCDIYKEIIHFKVVTVTLICDWLHHTTPSWMIFL